MDELLSKVTLVENPESPEYFFEIVRLANETEGWLRNEESIHLWKKHTDEFRAYYFVSNESQKAICGVSMARSHMADNKDKYLYYIGFFYCHRDWRGKGLGTILLNKCMEHAGDHNVALHSARDVEKYYENKYGFNKYKPYRYCGINIPYEDLTLPELEEPQTFSIKNISDVSEEEIRYFDKMITLQDRGDFFLSWLRMTHTKIAVNNNGNVVGIVSLCWNINRVISVAPLYADDEEIALHLLVSALRDCPFSQENTKFFIKFSKIRDKEVLRLVSNITNIHLEAKEGSRLQFTKEIIDVPEKKIFSLLVFGHTIV